MTKSVINPAVNEVAEIVIPDEKNLDINPVTAYNPYMASFNSPNPADMLVTNSPKLVDKTSAASNSKFK